MPIYALGDKVPVIDPTAFVHPEAVIIGDVTDGPVLHRAVVGPDAHVGANAVVNNDKIVPPRARALGVPAVITENAVPDGATRAGMEVYVAATHQYRAELRRID